jgi:hypothetical protein
VPTEAEQRVCCDLLLFAVDHKNVDVGPYVIRSPLLEGREAGLALFVQVSGGLPDFHYHLLQRRLLLTRGRTAGEDKGCGENEYHFPHDGLLVALQFPP